jgi:outer membrane protein
MAKRFLSIVLILLSVQVVQAQKKVWTFQQCLDTAIQRNISLNQTRLSNEINKVNLKQSKANRIPGLSANANEGFNFGRSINPTTNNYVNENYNSTSFAVNGSLNLFNGFQNNRTILENKMNIEAGMSDIEKVKNDVILNITTGYLQVLLYYEILDAANAQAKADTEQVDRTQKMVNAGKVPELNLYQIQSQLATDNLAVVNARSNLDLARVTLMQLMELPVVDSFDIVKPDLSEPSGALLQTNAEIYKKALATMPEITSASIRSNNALQAIKIYEGARWPSLNLTAGMNTNYASKSTKGTFQNPQPYPFNEQIWDNVSQNIGLRLAIPIYSNRQIRSSIDIAKINAMVAQLNEQNTKNVLRKTIEQAYTDLKNSLKKYEATREQLKTAEISYKSIEKKYNVGMVTAIDFLVEKNNFAQAQSNVIQSKYNYIFKSKVLDFYQGNTIKL